MPTKEQLKQQHLRRMKQIEIDNLAKEYKDVEDDARYKKGKKKFSASKIVIAAMIILCLQIILYAEWAMIRLHDLSALYVLIGVPATLAVSIWGFFSKSRAENTAGGIIYETAMEEMRQREREEDEVDDNGAVG